MILHGTKKGNGFELRCIKTKKPRMSSHFGRTWQCMTTILVHWDNHPEEEVNCYMDNTWSSWYYFKVNGQWYKFNGTEHEFGYRAYYQADFSNERNNGRNLGK